MTLSPLELVIAEADHDYLAQSAPAYLDAIRAEPASDKTPEQIKRIVIKATTPERAWLAQRCYNAALYLWLQRTAEVDRRDLLRRTLCQ